MAETKRVHAFVRGRVQGVFFRQTTQEAARGLGLSGWVRNLPDGRVECEAEGLREAVDTFVVFLGRGSPQSRVDGVDLQDLPEGAPLPRPFVIRR